MKEVRYSWEVSMLLEYLHPEEDTWVSVDSSTLHPDVDRFLETDGYVAIAMGRCCSGRDLDDHVIFVEMTPDGRARVNRVVARGDVLHRPFRQPGWRFQIHQDRETIDEGLGWFQQTFYRYRSDGSMVIRDGNRLMVVDARGHRMKGRTFMVDRVNRVRREVELAPMRLLARVLGPILPPLPM